MKNFIVCFFTILLVTACAKKETAAPSDAAYYTCTMHPSVHLMDPKAKCPICGMDLVAVMKAGTVSTNNTGPTEFTIAPDRQQLIGVTYATVTKQSLKTTLRTVGTVAYDKQRHWDYVSRVEGYVHKLEVSSRGDLVEKGQPLLVLESPDLLVAQREYVDLLRNHDEAPASDNKMLESARRRMTYWNVSEQQIQELEKTRQPQPYLTLSSPFKGVVQDLPVDQGRHVSAGDHLIDVADLSLVWVWADFYQEELPLLKTGLVVIVTTSAYPDTKFKGEISVIDPWMNDAKRTVRVRLDIPNPDLKLRPDMYVDAELQTTEGEGLVIPVNAVLPSGTRNLVFVDKGNGKLEPRYIELGRKFEDFYAVKTGLNEGDRVVSSANFLIDAEAKTQGALKSW